MTTQTTQTMNPAQITAFRVAHETWTRNGGGRGISDRRYSAKAFEGLLERRVAPGRAVCAKHEAYYVFTAAGLALASAMFGA